MIQIISSRFFNVADFGRTGFSVDIDEVCKGIQDGEYVIPPPETAYISTVRAFVDHYHKVMYCEIPKVGTTSLLSMFQQLGQKEIHEREQWFSKHPYEWIGKVDRWTE